MIDKQTFTKEWILGFRKEKEYSKSDPILIEKMILALTLAEELAKQKIELIFKGGTSLILLLNETNRFSIDIDIITSTKQEELNDKFNNIINNSVFTRVDYDSKRSFKNDIPKAHYRFYYLSALNGDENYILLDILFQDNPYPELLSIPIITPWLISNEPNLSIQIPSIESILGDKLTAFAPNTIGINYIAGKELEIIKQLFDISILTDKAKNLQIVRESFINNAIQEIKFKGINIKPEDVVNDIYQTAIIISKRDKNEAEEDHTKFNELQSGLINVIPYLVNQGFKIEEAIEASAKTAFLTQLLNQKRFNDFTLYSDTIDISGFVIENTDYGFLNRLKRTNPPAFYYWYKCLDLLNKNSK